VKAAVDRRIGAQDAPVPLTQTHDRAECHHLRRLGLTGAQRLGTRRSTNPICGGCGCGIQRTGEDGGCPQHHPLQLLSCPAARPPNLAHEGPGSSTLPHRTPDWHPGRGSRRHSPDAELELSNSATTHIVSRVPFGRARLMASFRPGQGRGASDSAGSRRGPSDSSERRALYSPASHPNPGRLDGSVEHEIGERGGFRGLRTSDQQVGGSNPSGRATPHVVAPSLVTTRCWGECVRRSRQRPSRVRCSVPESCSGRAPDR
jgi:hypothetical protein